MPSYNIDIIVKKLLVSGGGQLLGNDDSVKIAGVWVTSLKKKGVCILSWERLTVMLKGLLPLALFVAL